MNLIELSKYLQDEQAAENYLYEKGILKKYTECPHCGFDKLGHLSRNRIKCYKCKKEWHKRKGSFLEGKQISSSKFVAFLKLYADDCGVNTIYNELEIDKKTVIDLIKNTRQHLLQNKKVKIKNHDLIYLYDYNGELQLSINTRPNSNIYYTLNFICYKEQGSLYSFIINSFSNATGKHQMNSVDRFLSFAKMKLISYRGIKLEYLLEYLMELMIKFKNKEESYFEYLLKTLHFQRVVNFPPSS